MAKKKSANGANGFDGSVVEDYIDQLRDMDDEIASITGTRLAEVRAVRERQKQAIQEAKDAHGIPKQQLKMLHNHRKMIDKINEDRESLEDADRIESYDMLVEAVGGLGDLPLGKHVLEKAVH